MLIETLRQMIANDTDRDSGSICVGEHDGIETSLIKEYNSLVLQANIGRSIHCVCCNKEFVADWSNEEVCSPNCAIKQYGLK